ncbi:MAG: efflux transporter outer membrane subunit, partial [Burkholderiaceae bacterium]
MANTKFLGILTASIVVMLSGCVVGPDYHARLPESPAGWNSPLEGGLLNQSATVTTWWREFHDDGLTSLIERAKESNLDLRVAQARLRQARAQRDFRADDLAPIVSSSTLADRARQSQNQPLIGALPLPANFPFEYDVYQTGFDAAWELDLFGGKRRALDAATADWQGAIEGHNDVLVSLLAEVARNYIKLRSAQQRLAINARDLAAEKELFKLASARRDGGVATDFDVTRAAAQLSGLEALIPPFESAERTAMYSLAVLLGMQPGALVDELSPAHTLPPLPPEVPVGLPSELLRRRPDVRRAERQLAAETARIGVAEAEWFPKISLTGDFGVESVSVSKWFEPGSRFWSIGPSISWNALDFGRVRATIHAQTAAQEAASVAYQKAALVALEETESALVTYAQERNRDRALSDTVDANRRSLELADSLYHEGRVNFLDVLDARRSLFQAEDQLAVSEAAVSLDLIALYKALGG